MEHTEPHDLETLNREATDSWRNLKGTIEESSESPPTDSEAWRSFETLFDDLTSRVEKIADVVKGGFVTA